MPNNDLEFFESINYCKRKVVLFILFVCGYSLTYAQTNDNDTLQFIKNRDPEVACYRIPLVMTAANGDPIAAIDKRFPYLEI